MKRKDLKGGVVGTYRFKSTGAWSNLLFLNSSHRYQNFFNFLLDVMLIFPFVMKSLNIVSQTQVGKPFFSFWEEFQ